MKSFIKLCYFTSFLCFPFMAMADHSLVTIKPIIVDFQPCFQGTIRRLQYDSGYNTGSLFINSYWNSMGGELLGKCERFDEIKGALYNLNEDYLNQDGDPSTQYICRLEGQVRGAVARAWALSERCQTKAVENAVDDGVRTGVNNADLFCETDVPIFRMRFTEESTQGQGQVEIPEFPDVVETYIRYARLSCEQAFINRVSDRCPRSQITRPNRYHTFKERCELD